MPYGATPYGTATYGEGISSTPTLLPPSPTVGFPTLLIEIAFTTTPLSGSPVWVDVTRYARAGTIRRGRSNALELVVPGTLELTFGNMDRRFDPFNVGGPYAGNLSPNKRIRVRATFEDVTYPLFDGFIEDYEQSYAFGDREAVCKVTASDALAMFASMGLAAASRSIETAGARIAAVLDNPRVVWPAAMRFLDVGSSKCAAEFFDDTLTALDALHEVDLTEQGRLFVSASGDVVFLDRNTLVTDPTYTSDQVVFGDDLTGAEVPYADIKFDHGRDLIRNAVTVTNPVWGTFTAEDATSQDDYGTRTHDVTVIDAAGVASQQTANNLLRLYKDPQSRVKTLKVKARRTTAGWPTGLFPAVLPLDLGWRVGVKRRGSPDYTIDQHYAVESLTHEFVARDRSWECEFGFGIPQSTEAYWIWGTGQWGSTTRWAW